MLKFYEKRRNRCNQNKNQGPFPDPDPNQRGSGSAALPITLPFLRLLTAYAVFIPISTLCGQ
jgi:hypothetical protein